MEAGTAQPTLAPPLALQAQEASTARPLLRPLPWRCCLFQEVFLDSCQVVFPSLTLLSAHVAHGQGLYQLGAP